MPIEVVAKEVAKEAAKKVAEKKSNEMVNAMGKFDKIVGDNKIEKPSVQSGESKTDMAKAKEKFDALMGDDKLKSSTKNADAIKGSETNEVKNDIYDRIPRGNGEWKGPEGDSRYVPNPDEIPPERRGNTKTNEGNLTNKQIAEKYNVKPEDGYLYEKGDLNLDDVSKGTVEIEGMSENRYTKNGQEGNFEKADKKLAEQRGCSPDEVAKWRAENNYTYHERQDCKTMQKVPNEIHGNLPHKGGVSVIKERNSAEEGIFDE